jgi:DNA-binding LacI/PurR family transcriptional regulator
MPTCQKPKYLHLADTLRSRIQSGELKAGDRLPSLVQMYRDHGATQATMHRVYELLEKENLIERRGGSGVYVTEGKSTFTGTVGIIGRKDSYYGQANYNYELLGGIERFTAQNNQHVLFLGNYTNPDLSAYEKVDGVLTFNVEYQAERLKYLPPILPRVSLFIKENEAANVVADDMGGAKQATEHLIQLGHQRISCLFEKHLSVSRQRLAGYREALDEAGIEGNVQWMRLTDVLYAGENHPTYLEWGHANMKEWLREGWADLGCSAILAQNDAAAIGVMQALQKEGIDVPGQVSVMGFDGTELCNHVTPKLCSMKIPFAEIGYKAAEILHQQIYRGQREIQTIMLPMSLRAGGSVAPITTS